MRGSLVRSWMQVRQLEAIRASTLERPTAKAHDLGVQWRSFGYQSVLSFAKCLRALLTSLSSSLEILVGDLSQKGIRRVYVVLDNGHGKDTVLSIDLTWDNAPGR